MKQNLRLLLTLLLLLALGSENSFAAYSETTFKSDFSDGDYVVFADYTGDDAVVPDWMKLPNGTKSIKYQLNTTTGQIEQTSSNVMSPFVKTSSDATLKLNVNKVSNIKVFYRNNGTTERTLKATVNEEAEKELATIAPSTNGVANVALSYADENIVLINGSNEIVIFGIQVECNNSTLFIAAPVFNPEQGVVESGTTIKCSSETEGTTVYYTTDGSAPTNKSAVFPSAGISITKDTNFKAIAYDNNGNKSSVVSAEYTIKASVTALTTVSSKLWVFGSEFEELPTTFSANTVVDNMEISAGTKWANKDEGYMNIEGDKATTRLNITQNLWLHIKVAENSRITFYAASSGNGTRNIKVTSDVEGTDSKGTFTVSGGGSYDAYSFAYNGTESDLFFTNTTNGGCYIVGVKVEPLSNEITPILTATDVKVKVGKTANSTITAKNGEEEIEGLTYTYEVTTGTDFASVDENGVVTGIAIGNAVVTVTSSAVEGQYQSATTTFNVTVTEDVTASGVYKKVTSTDQLEAGKEYIIVAYDAEGNPLNYAMGSQNGNFRSRVSAKVLTSNDEDYVTITDNDAVTMVILGGETGAWTFCTYDENDYLCLPSANNYLKTEATVSSKSKWTIKDDLTIWNNWNNAYTLQYNSTTGQERFSCYKNTQKPAYLFVKVESIPVDITKVGYGTLYYSDKDLIVPSGVKAMTYKLTTSGDDIRILDTYEAGDIIPKDCGVVLQALNESDKTQTFHFAEGTALDVAPEDNILYGSDEPTMTNEIVEGDNLYYVLSTDKNGENVGFYWGAKKGAAFMNGAHKAFLAIPKSSGVNASSFVFDELTGIRAITVDSTEGAEGVYTLSGMRIDGKQLPKGIYIVNGKKMVIK